MTARARIASLPMYDLPELRAETDALWAALARAMAAEGLEGAPPALTRDRSHREVWVDPDLLLGQTCGYPFTHELAGRVQLVATPRFAVPACAGAWYTSRVVVRAGLSAARLEDLAGAVCAATEKDSQSGMSALRAVIAPLASARGGGRSSRAWSGRAVTAPASSYSRAARSTSPPSTA